LLRITPKISFFLGTAYLSTSVYRPDDLEEACRQRGALPKPSIEVINMSKFAITIDELGFCDTTPKSGLRFLFHDPRTIPEMKPPYRLEPRSSATFISHNADENFGLIRLIPNTFMSSLAVEILG